MATPLDALKAALEAKREAEREWEKYDVMIVATAESRYAALNAGRARNRYTDLLTDDTIAALIAVAEAVEAIYFDDDDDWHREWIRVPEAKAALARLEATDA